jgi:hypothetical protein
VQDGIHLSGIGIHAYYQQIRIALGQPEVLLTGPSLRQVKRPSLPSPMPTPASSSNPAASPSETVIPTASSEPPKSLIPPMNPDQPTPPDN